MHLGGRNHPGAHALCLDSTEGDGMKRAILYLWRHPRRTGFIIFNLIVLALLLAWAQFTSSMSHEGLAALPNVMLGFTGMALMVVALIVGWIAWAVMVSSRHAHLATLETARSEAQARADG